MQENNKNNPKRSDDRKGSTRKNIRFEDSLLVDIDKHRELSNQSFAEWVKTACFERLEKK
jgi:hypothetical protein